MKRAAELQLAEFLEPDEIAASTTTSTPWRIIGLVATPSILLIKASFYSGIAVSLLALWGRTLDFRKGIAVILTSSSVFLLEGVVTAVILSLRGLENIYGPGDLSPPLGLDLLFSSSSAFLSSILGNLNLFEAWYYLLLAAGLSTVGAHRLREGAAVAGVVWWIGVVAEARLQSFLDTVTQAFN
ncbi:MAG: hypothetical protein JSU96_02970 [Acidobacteriota bacterium]|nr:MAG: hypothetical protein JSU96_02970 [Acidobacteriota bacterium]